MYVLVGGRAAHTNAGQHLTAALVVSHSQAHALALLACLCCNCAGFGGTFLSMAFEDPCFVYVGASGAVFGFIGECCVSMLLVAVEQCA